MEFAGYQCKSYTAIQDHNQLDDELIHWALGLNEEAGEVAGAVKHMLYGGDDFSAEKLAEELGDVLWYTAALCTAAGINLNSVAELNIAKVRHRYHGADEFDEDACRRRHELMEDFKQTAIYKSIVSNMRTEHTQY